MYEGLSDQSIALKNGVGDIAAMAKSSFVHTPKIKDIIWNVDYDILQTRYSAKCNRKEYAQCQRKRNLQYTSEVYSRLGSWMSAGGTLDYFIKV